MYPERVFPSVPVGRLDEVKRLIVNADDFGLTSGINQAVLELNRRGVLSSTTLMAMAPETREATSLIQSGRNLGIGCHVVLVDGAPVSPTSNVFTLINPATGRFRGSLGLFVRDLLLGNIRESQIQSEAEAQIASLQSQGVQLTHLDTHKHTHMFPAVLRPILLAAKHLGVPSIRNPFEPTWSENATAGAPLLRRFQVRVLRRNQNLFRQMVEAAGLATTDGTAGVLATGTLDAATLEALLQAIPEGTWELVTHPGRKDAQLCQTGTRLTTSREIELNALNSLKLASTIRLIHFGDLTAD